METKHIKPQDIKPVFWSSIFGNSETETILSNLVKMQTSFKEWRPFTFEEDYKTFCTHDVTSSEKGVMDALVNGGKPVMRTTAVLTEGWLSFDGTHYAFTDKLIEYLYENYPRQAQ